MNSPLIPVVVGLIFDETGCILTSRRQSHQSQGGRWEFPGGKIEAGEGAYEALVRELEEEVGIAVQAAEPLMTLEHDYADYGVALEVFVVKAFTGVPEGCEGQEVQWVARDALSSLDFLAGNDTILARLSQNLVRY